MALPFTCARDMMLVIIIMVTRKTLRWLKEAADPRSKHCVAMRIVHLTPSASIWNFLIIMVTFLLCLDTSKNPADVR